MFVFDYLKDGASAWDHFETIKSMLSTHYETVFVPSKQDQINIIKQMNFYELQSDLVRDPTKWVSSPNFKAFITANLRRKKKQTMNWIKLIPKVLTMPKDINDEEINEMKLMKQKQEFVFTNISCPECIHRRKEVRNKNKQNKNKNKQKAKTIKIGQFKMFHYDGGGAIFCEGDDSIDALCPYDAEGFYKGSIIWRCEEKHNHRNNDYYDLCRIHINHLQKQRDLES